MWAKNFVEKWSKDGPKMEQFFKKKLQVVPDNLGRTTGKGH